MPEFNPAIDLPEFSGTASHAVGTLWANGRFVYELSPEVATNPGQTAVFEAACERLLGTTALACTPRSDFPEDTDYVYVISGAHDYSFIGRQGGCQLLSILTWSNPIIVAHEIKHALGWAHEQQHPQRDQFIVLSMDDIAPEHQAEFQVVDLGNEGPYDFDSIMHFYPADFAHPGRKAFRPRQHLAGQDLHPGQRDHLSSTDLDEIRMVYGVRIVK